jgi:hypothetical protein
MPITPEIDRIDLYNLIKQVRGLAASLEHGLDAVPDDKADLSQNLDADVLARGAMRLLAFSARFYAAAERHRKEQADA